MILSIRSPSPTIHTIRRRSPSPIKTGVVNRARTRFETSGCEQGGHQTLPRAFKLGASSRVNIAERTVAPKSGLSGPMRTSEPLATSSYRTDMVQVGFIRFPIHTIHSIVTKSEYSIPSKCCIGINIGSRMKMATAALLGPPTPTPPSRDTRPSAAAAGETATAAPSTVPPPPAPPPASVPAPTTSATAAPTRRPPWQPPSSPSPAAS